MFSFLPFFNLFLWTCEFPSDCPTRSVHMHMQYSIHYCFFVVCSGPMHLMILLSEPSHLIVVGAAFLFNIKINCSMAVNNWTLNHCLRLDRSIENIRFCFVCAHRRWFTNNNFILFEILPLVGSILYSNRILFVHRTLRYSHELSEFVFEKKNDPNAEARDTWP